jgi:hypothetical protein
MTIPIIKPELITMAPLPKISNGLEKKGYQKNIV